MDTTAPVRPRFSVLTPEECERLLARNNVGRLAYARGAVIDVVPLHYVYHDGWLYGRTSPGTRLRTVGEKWWPVAFEVDEVDGLFQWRSVVVHGGFYPIPADGTEPEQAEWRRGVELLRELIPGTFTAHDPVPHRTVLFRIAVQEVSGRAADHEDDADR
jgi:uncharacterized protein